MRIAEITVKSSRYGGQSVGVVQSPDGEKFIFAIDSLASRSSERLGNTIQISNTGIIPGTGVGHYGSKIDESTIGIPVIAIGVPTVLSFSRKFAADEKLEADLKGCFISPRGINRIVRNGAKIIGGGINQAFGICYF